MDKKSYISSAIIGRHTTNALLAYASKEKLIWSTRETDGVFERIVSSEYHPLIFHQLRERLVVSPKLVFCDFPDFLWEALDGPLKNDGFIANIPPQNSNNIRPKTIPLDVISGMLGNVVTENDLEVAQKKVAKALDEQENYEKSTGKKAPNVFKEHMVTSISTIDGGHSISEYSSWEIQAQKERDDVFRMAQPYISAAEEYTTLANTAYKFGIMLGTPLIANNTAANLINPTFTPESNDSEIALFRIVCGELGKTTLRSTITETLKLSKEPATKALREMIPIWQSQITLGNEQELNRLKSEIASANKALSEINGVQTAGKVTTWLAIPIQLVESLFNLLPIMGFTANLIGVFAIQEEKGIREKYLWATYGSSNY